MHANCDKKTLDKKVITAFGHFYVGLC